MVDDDTGPMTDRGALGMIRALNKVADSERRRADGKPAPMAMCPRCKTEPLVFTFDRPRYEFHCVICGGWYGFLDPLPAEPTPEIETRLYELKALYAASKTAIDPEPRRE